MLKSFHRYPEEFSSSTSVLSKKAMRELIPTRQIVNEVITRVIKVQSLNAKPNVPESIMRPPSVPASAALHLFFCRLLLPAAEYSLVVAKHAWQKMPRMSMPALRPTRTVLNIPCAFVRRSVP